MKMRIDLLLIVTVFFLSCNVALSQVQQVIDPKSFEVTNDGADILVTWRTLDETNVKEFQVQRRSGEETDFSQIGIVPAAQLAAYIFRDHSAFKKTSTYFTYRIVVIFSNDHAPIISAEKGIDHSVSGVRRTWGSIKSMFRF